MYTNSTLKRPRPQPEQFTVGWISALPVELTAATAMLDEKYDDSGYTTQYTLGRIGGHNVVITCLPAGQYGTNSAAVAATRMQLEFRALQIGLMVGIGGGVPSPEVDIRLGDAVISQPQAGYGGVVQYDYGKTGSGGLCTRTGYLNAPPNVLLTAVSKLRSNISAGKSNPKVHLSSLAHLPEFERRNAGSDTLFQSSYSHIEGLTCDRCRKDMVVARTPRESEEVVIHYGTIASGNQVIKDGLTRDKLSAELGGVLCFEMEAAGLMNSFPCLIIRGICDYADSHKNKKWQPFAAAVAAACAREILSIIPTGSYSNNYSTEVTRQLATNPKELSRSNGPDDTPTENVASLCVRLVLTAAQRESYLHSLRFDQIDARHATIRTAHAKTCRWLLSKSEYQDWLDVSKLSDHHGFLWIKGKPATGKSTIMKFAYTDAKKKKADTVVISFFFNARGDELEKSSLGMYRSLFFQLLEQLPELQDVFDSLRPSGPINSDSYRWDIEIIQSLFEHAIKRIGKHCVTCFVDALDECDEDQVREMVSFFEQLGQLAVSSQFRLLVCFSSRHYPHITIEKGIQLILEGQEGHQQDIANYLRSELKIGRSKLAEQIKAEILERASGIFLWVVLVIQMLSKEYDRGRIHALRKRLDEIPNGLDELFKDILTRDGQNIEELILCLQCILYAKRPLKREELYFAVLAGVAPEALTAWTSEEITEQDMERFILSSSKGLAELTKSKNQTVQFIHESVRDFLLKGNGLDRLRSDLRSNFSGLSHERLKQCCQNYMTINTSEQLDLVTPLPIASSEDAAILRRQAFKMFPFLEYAVRNVLYHADTAQRHKISQDRFVENFPLQKWITLDNLFERYQIRRHTSDASLLYILAEKNLPNLISIELKRVPHMDIEGERYSYPLHAAIAHANENAVRALLAPSTNARSDYDVLHEQPLRPTAREHEEVIEYFISERHDIRFGKGWRIFPKSVERRDLALSKVLLATRKVDTNAQTYLRQSLLSLAAESGHEAIVKFLLADGVDTNSKDSIQGRTPLSWAAGNGLEAIVKLLVEQSDVEADSKDIEDRTPLSWAAGNGHDTVVKLLVEQSDVEADSKGIEDRTPLSWAAGDGHEAVVKLLVERSDVEADSKSMSRTPLSWAAGNGHEAVVKLLVERNDVEADSKDNRGQTPLSLAAEKGHKAVVKLLVERSDVEADSKDIRGRTPLLLAVEGGHKAIVKLLVERSDVEAHSKDNMG